jgi:hypothetical protein
LHRIPKCPLVGSLQWWQANVESVELEAVSVTASGRTRTAVDMLAKVVDARVQRFSGVWSFAPGALWQPSRFWRQIVQDPVNESLLRSVGISRVGIVDD